LAGDRVGTWLRTYNGLWLLDMFVSEEELAVEVAEVDGVEIDDVDFAEAGQGEVLEEFAADAASAD
jgi:hypothetical protein